MGRLGGCFAEHDENCAGDENHADDDLDDAHSYHPLSGSDATACRLQHLRQL